MEQRRSALESNCFFPNLKISILIDQISKMSKNPIIDSDISQVLDEFLQKLNECDKYLANGIFNMNFAEAALLLQSSTDLYGKKVDLLWDIIFDYQKRILLCDDLNADKEQEIEKLEERKRKYKRKRKANSDQSQATKLVNDFTFGNVEGCDYLSQTFEQSNLLEEWQKFNVDKHGINDRGQEASKNAFFLPNNAVYTEDDEYVGRYEQFHSASLIEDIFHLEEANLLKDEYSCVTQMRIDSYVINDFLIEKSIPHNKPLEGYVSDLNQYITSFIESKQKHSDGQLSCKVLQQVYRKESFVSLEKLPFNVLRDKFRRMSMADSLFDDDNLSSISENCSSPVESNEIRASEDVEIESHMSVDQITGTIDKRSKSCSKDSAFYELEDIEEQTNEKTSSTPSSAPVIASPITNKQPCCGCSVVVPKLRTAQKKTPLPKDEEFINRRKLKRKSQYLEKQLKKLCIGRTFTHSDFEKFFRSHYQPAENEGQIPTELSESEDSDGEDDISETNECFEESPYLDPTEDLEIADSCLDLPDPSLPTQIPELTSCWNPPITSTPQNRLTQPNFSDVEPEHEETLRKAVREWRSFIMPKLKTMENRSDFDIHEYGWKIIEPSKVGEVRPFKSLVTRKGPAEVARYFIATLQLANTNNVEICGAVPGKISNESFQIKTVDKTKYHELLEEYQAPSEETFRERLERAQALKPKIPLHSTPRGGPPSKKIKLGNCSKKLF